MRKAQAAAKKLISSHGTLTAAARASGIDAGYLCRIAQGKHPQPGDETLRKLGIRRRVIYTEM